MGEKRPEWATDLDEREWNEVKLAQVYAQGFHHGTSGHLGYMVLAKLAEKLNEREPPSNE